MKNGWKLFAFAAMLALLLTGCAQHLPILNPPRPPVNPDWTVTVKWNYDFTNFQKCSATVTQGCISSFTWGYLQGLARIPVHTAPLTVCAGSNCTETVNTQLGVGPHTFYVRVNAIDNSGAPISADGLTVAVTDIPAGAPTNVVVTIAP